MNGLRLAIKRMLCDHFHSYKVVVETTPPIVIFHCKECGIVTAQKIYEEQWNDLIKNKHKGEI